VVEVGGEWVKNMNNLTVLKAFPLTFPDLIHKEFNVLPHSLLSPIILFFRLLWVRIKNSDAYSQLPFMKEKYYTKASKENIVQSLYSLERHAVLLFLTHNIPQSTLTIRRFQACISLCFH
jgi:hypothetical protein